MAPLMQGKSKKAFQENVKTEVDAGKPQKQSLAIASSVKRKNAKKMASGGITTSAPAEARGESQEAKTAEVPETMAEMRARHASEMHEMHMSMAEKDGDKAQKVCEKILSI